MLSFPLSFVSFRLCEWTANDLLEAHTFLLCSLWLQTPQQEDPALSRWSLRKKENSGIWIPSSLKTDILLIMEFLYQFRLDCTKISYIRLLWWLSGKESACPCRRHGFDPWSQEHLSCRGTTKSIHHNHWACALESENCSYWSLST